MIRLDNPFKTIFQMCELSLMNEGKTIYQTLTEGLESLVESGIENPVADRRLNAARKFIVDHYSSEMIDSDNEVIQVHILRSMKQNLTEDD